MNPDNQSGARTVRGPLSGLKVLDFSTLLPGPYATQLLADMGADVLRIEAPARFDMMREVEPKVNGASYSHASVNRSKRSLALDLKHPDAISIVSKLLADHDIVVEQFRPGVMQRLGLGYEALAAINPRLIYCSITGYGQTGPLKDRAGHDINYLSLSGMASFSGRQETGPVLSGTQVADVGGGSHHAVMGILAAVIERHSTGKGQAIDISMSDAALAMTTMFGASYLGGGPLPGYASEMLNGGTFYDYYRTADDRHLSVGSLEPQFSKAFFAAIGQPEWQSRAGNPDHSEQMALKADIQSVLEQKTLAQWQPLFAAIDACVEPVLTLAEATELEHFKRRNMIIQTSAPDGSPVRQLGCPIKFSGSNLEVTAIGARLGAHSRAVLAEYGYSEEAITALLETGAIC